MPAAKVETERMAKYLVLFLVLLAGSVFADDQKSKENKSKENKSKEKASPAPQSAPPPPAAAPQPQQWPHHPLDFSFNPNPFWCNSVPGYAPCAQPAIPICCGPCYQAQPVAVAPAPAPAGTPAPAPAGTPAPANPPASAAPSTPAASATPGAPVASTPAVPVAGSTAAPAGSTPAAPASSTGNCPLACPFGWSTWGLSDHCYLMPTQPVKSDTFWNQQAYCKSKEPTSYILTVDGLVEQALGSAVSLQYFPSWAAQLTNVYWWLGGYTEGTKWKYLDGEDLSGSVLMIAANLVGGGNNTCLGADPKTLGLWQTYSCDAPNGAVICEMAKRPVCGEAGGNLPISPISLTVDSLKNLFPKMPSIPFLGSLLSGAANGLSGLLGEKAKQ